MENVVQVAQRGWHVVLVSIDTILENLRSLRAVTTKEIPSIFERARVVQQGLLEVWAVASDTASFGIAQKNGQLNHDIRECARVQRARVDRRDFVDDLADGLFGSKVFGHRKQTQGRD